MASNSSTSSWSSLGVVPNGHTPSSTGHSRDFPVAVVGLAFQFPGADTAESFWDLVMSGKSTVSEFPPTRLCSSKFHGVDDGRKGTIRTKKACFLERDIATFDAKFFGMTPEEAGGTDPQQRILLETTYRALENAGIPMEQISGSDTSVHTGYFTADYMLASGKDPENGPKYSSTGMAGSMLSNRISTFFNLTGPSVSIDTACSSSLVALDLACKSLSQGDSSMGIVAGCNLLLTVDYFISLSSLGFLSPDGICHSFDDRANGYGRGEGFGVLIVKPLHAAIQDGDTIRAVIRATRSNQNGRTNLAQPSKEMQMQLIDDVYRNAQLDMSLTNYFEAHGTGTAIGDPLEAMAIGNTFGPKRPTGHPLLIGALKANIGHLEGAAGIASVIKTILILERGIIPPIADFNELNRNIDSDSLKLKFPRTPQPWPRPGLRRASVNGFGFGGTNSHVILDDAFHYLEEHGLVGKHSTIHRSLEQYPSLNGQPPKPQVGSYGMPSPIVQSDSGDVPKLLVWSANDQDTTTRVIDTYQKYLQQGGHASARSVHLDSLAHTLASRRSLHAWRVFEVSSSIPQLAEQLRAPRFPVQAKSSPKAGFIFTGQGAQWHGMGKELLVFDVFRNSILEAGNFLQSIGCPWNAIDMFSGEEAGQRINDPQFAQPLCTILQVALVELLHSFNIYPASIIGHSSGEIAAAYTFGAICRESAWKLAYFRGMLSSHLSKSSKTEHRGAMMAVGASELSLQPHIKNILAGAQDGVLSVACINSPLSTTISGDETLVQDLQTILQADGIFTRFLKVPVAYHSPHILSIATDYKNLIGTLNPGSPPPGNGNMISSVTGDNITRTELQRSDYWVQNMVSAVQFSAAIGRLCRNSVKEARKKLDLSHRNLTSVSHIVEIGPHPALQGPIHDIIKAEGLSRNDLSCSPTLVRSQGAVKKLFETIGKLHCSGFNVNLELVNNPSGTPNSLCQVITTLPEYPFDHSQSYWDEPRISRSMRLPSHPYSEFIGTPVADWNPLEPRWRNTLKTSTIGWLEDHKINGEILFPAAGMLVSAIEAVTQVSTDENIVAYEIKDMEILSALAIPRDDVGVEVQFCLKLSQDSTNKTNSWAAFSLFAYRSNDSSVEVCRGSIKTILSAPGHAELNPEGEHQASYVRDLMSSARTSFTSRIEAKQLYTRFADNGYLYGPWFQQIDSAEGDNRGRAIGHVSTMGLPAQSDRGVPSVIHPSTLDSMLQLILPAAARADDSKKPVTWVPTYISKLWISASSFEKRQAEVYVSTDLHGARLCVSRIYAMDKAGNDRLIQAEGIESSVISVGLDSQGSDAAESRVKRLCWDLVHKPDITLLDAEKTDQYLRTALFTKSDPTELLRVVKLHILASISRAVDAVPEAVVPLEPPHLREHYVWIQKAVASAKKQPPLGVPLEWPIYKEESKYAALCSHLETTDKLGAIYVQLGNHITNVLKGDTDALASMERENVFRDYYDMLLKDSRFLPPLDRYLDAMAHKNPAMNILEVGAGTGAATRHILNTLVKSTLNGPFCRFSKYDFTDISQSFLDAASGDLKAMPKMNFHLFDVEADPIDQGFEEYSYDVVICVNVLHATKSTYHSLENMRRLLRDDGKLILVDTTDPTSLIAHSIFRYLPELGHSNKPWSGEDTCSSHDQWDRELRASGFTGADLVFNDHECEENQSTALFISSPAKITSSEDEYATIKGKEIVVITGWEKTLKCSLTETAFSTLTRMGCPEPRHSDFHEAAELEEIGNKIVLVIQDPGWPSLGLLDTNEFGAFHSTLKRSKHVIWIAETAPNPEVPSQFGLIQGLARALRMERHDLVLTTLALDPTDRELASTNLERAFRNFLQGIQSGSYERELAQVGEYLNIPRIYECDELNQKVHEFTSDAIVLQQRFGERNVNLKIRQPGLLDTLYFEEAPSASSPLAPGEVEVEVKAVGVNFKDCLIALGRVAEDTLGTECAGVVRQAGPSCALKSGDRVLVSALDTFKGLIRCPETLAAKIPDAMPFADAGALVTNFVTAYHSLVGLARLSPGESVLIHSGAGGTGQAAIQIAQFCGADIYTTVGSSSKRELLTSLYGIPPERILNSRDLSFAEGVKRLTNQKGVDVVLNSLAGDALVASWECIAPYGRFIEIGKKDIFGHNKLPMFQFARNVSFSAVDIGAMTYEKPELIREALTNIVDMFSRNILRTPSPMNTFPISQVEAAFRYLQSGSNAGKVVVEIDPEEVITASIKSKPHWSFSSEESFVIAGGLGGQGRSIAKWMVSRGARHLVLLSRSGLQDRNHDPFIADLQGQGAEIYCPQCDIADAASLRAVINYCKANLPPIRGCIQAAMNIKDIMFENMGHDAWSASLRPKVLGSWNLHQELPRDLDFFVIFSSVAAIIGSQGQSNYAAANAFEDELAQYRLGRGEKAVSLNLSLLAGEGYAVENQKALMQFMTIKQMLLMSQPEVFAILDHYCNKAVPAGSLDRSQVVMGLEIPGDLLDRGREPSAWAQEPLFANLHQITPSATGLLDNNKNRDDNGQGVGGGPGLIKQIEGAASHTEAAGILTEGLVAKLCRILSLAPDAFDRNSPLHTYGVDSLIAVELRNWFLKALKVDVAVFEILGGATATTLGQAVVEKMQT